MEKRIVVNAYAQMLTDLDFNVLADVPSSATPLVSSLCDTLFMPQVTPRMDHKSYGSGAVIDGIFKQGNIAAVVDDVITTSKSKIEAIDILKAGGLEVHDVLVLVDREQGGQAQLAMAGYKLHAYTTMLNLVEYCYQKRLVTSEDYLATMNYLQP